MASTSPAYVRVPGIQSEIIRYPWDDWNVQAVDLPLDPTLAKRLSGVSARAIAAFTIGTAEWIVFRFACLSDDPRPGQYLEAGWAGIVDFAYADERDVDLGEWRGPVRGPLGYAVRRVIFALQQAATNGDPAWRAGRAAKLARHVLPDAAPFESWEERVLDRLTALYPVSSEDPLGEVVPQEALDPDIAFDIGQTEALVNAFLSRIDWRENPFLLAPEAMRERGFKDTPYLFDAARERRRRLDW